MRLRNTAGLNIMYRINCLPYGPRVVMARPLAARSKGSNVFARFEASMNGPHIGRVNPNQNFATDCCWHARERLVGIVEPIDRYVRVLTSYRISSNYPLLDNDFRL